MFIFNHNLTGLKRPSLIIFIEKQKRKKEGTGNVKQGGNMIINSNSFDPEVKGLMKSLSKIGDMVTLKKREAIEFDCDFIYFLYDGHLACCSLKSGILISRVLKGMPLNTYINHDITKVIYFSAMSEVIFMKINKSKFNEFIRKNPHCNRVLNKLEIDLFKNTMSTLNVIALSCGYKQICVLLNRFIKESFCDESILTFIARRTSLSKGYIQYVVNSLKKKRYRSAMGN